MSIKEAKRCITPIIIGITGHRDIINFDKQLLVDFFINLHENYKNTPFILLTPLAEGADRIITKVALKVREEKNIDIKIISPFPLPIEDYKKDFGTKDILEEFDKLKSNVDEYFELPLPEGIKPDEIKQYGEKRDRCYEQVGKYISEQSHILIALWDGVDNKKIGGTAHIVSLREKGYNPLNPPDSTMEFSERGLVIHFVSQRKNPDPNTPKFEKPIRIGHITFKQDIKCTSWEWNEIGDIDKLLPSKFKYCLNKLKDVLKLYANKLWTNKFTIFSNDFYDVLKPYERIDKYNRDIKKYLSKKEAEARIEESKSYIWNNEKENCRNKFEKPSLSPEQNDVLTSYAIADCLSQEFQTRTTANLKLILAMAALFAVSYEFYDNIVTESGVLTLPIICLFTGIGIYLYAKYRQYQTKYIDYRALAECLRIQFFWTFADFEDKLNKNSVDNVSNYYLKKHYGELIWIRYAVKSLAFNVTPGDKSGRKTIKEHWLCGQASWYAKKSREQMAWNSKLENYVKVFFILAIIFILSRFFIHSPLITLFIAASFVISAVIDTYIDKTALDAQAKQYMSMNIILNEAIRFLKDICTKPNNEKKSLNNETDNKSKDIEKFEEIEKNVILDMCKTALEENTSWAELRRNRPIDPPR